MTRGLQSGLVANVASYATKEHVRAVGTHYGLTWIHRAYTATPLERRHSWYYETQKPLQQQHDCIDTRDDCGSDGAVSQTHWKPRPELDIDLNPDHPSPSDSEERSQARWLTAAGRRRLCSSELDSSILFSLSVRLFIGAAKIKTSSRVHLLLWRATRTVC